MHQMPRINTQVELLDTGNAHSLNSWRVNKWLTIKGNALYCNNILDKGNKLLLDEMDLFLVGIKSSPKHFGTLEGRTQCCFGKNTWLLSYEQYKKIWNYNWLGFHQSAKEKTFSLSEAEMEGKNSSRTHFCRRGIPTQYWITYSWIGLKCWTRYYEIN